MRMISIFVFLAFLPSATFAQQPLPGNMPLDRHGNTPANSQTIHDHAGAMNHDDAHTNETRDLPREAGQSAFAAIQEIVVLLEADRKTDWSRVDIEALRQHLIDMQNVTLSTKVLSREISIGIRFEATSDTPAVAASIKRMVIAHVMTMDGVNGWTLEAAEIPGGATLTVTPANASDLDKIRGLGFIGVMTVGMHHQEHHLAIATGRSPH
ncbi:MAG TPA: hypothetical protein DIC56_14410 [Rhizobium sp.]|nr:hypothetical protein [Rhizobium sp.]